MMAQQGAKMGVNTVTEPEGKIEAPQAQATAAVGDRLSRFDLSGRA